ncbi:MAG: hypothetical protein IJ180_06380 [Bacteroidales bacterium]|nr:hypothetical protein [Bacteroidales bacterium]
MCKFLVDLCVSLGGLGTLGTFIYMIKDSKNKSKQLYSVQRIESMQMNALYKPDIRISHKRTPVNSHSPSEIILSNYGETIEIVKYKDISNHLDTKSLNEWPFPLHIDKNKDVRIPLSHEIGEIPDNIHFELIIKNKLSVLYSAVVYKENGRPLITIKESQNH